MDENNEKRWVVYQHKNKTNGKSYIGITCETVQKRWGKNGYRYKEKYQPKFYRAIKKYGWDNFEHNILLSDLTYEEAIQKEKELIEFYDSYNNGYNNTKGGEGFLPGEDNPMWGKHPIFSEEHKNKIKKTQIKNMKKVILYNIDTQEIIQEFESIKDAAKKMGTHKSNIQEQCKTKPTPRIRNRIRYIFKEDLEKWKKLNIQ